MIISKNAVYSPHYQEGLNHEQPDGESCLMLGQEYSLINLGSSNFEKYRVSVVEAVVKIAHSKIVKI